MRTTAVRVRVRVRVRARVRVRVRVWFTSVRLLLREILDSTVAECTIASLVDCVCAISCLRLCIVLYSNVLLCH